MKSVWNSTNVTLQKQPSAHEDEELLQGKEKGTRANHSVNSVIQSKVEQLKGSGQPLSDSLRSYYEPRFGYDFSQVRLHTDARAAQTAHAIQAKGFTIGNNIVFGANQYAPNTSEGKKLLAHELSHIIQQNRFFRNEVQTQSFGTRVAEDSGLIQLTPAAPSYGGVTGVRDLSKIRIDAIADFVASGFTAARDVNVHLNDARVTHISWEFYDPNDQLLPGSYSTLPGQPASTSRPFRLEPAHFSGSGFVAGKYILRCIGRDSGHKPVIYADRDFNVLQSDMTTGTALATTYGALTFTKYGKTDANPPASTSWSVDIELKFMPKTTVACNDVTFIQALDSIDSQGRSLHHFVSSEQDARQTPLAWSIDRVAGAPSPFYISGRGPGGTIIDEPGWGQAGRGGATPGEASLIDRPSWNMESVDRFESCVICRSGANRGQVYGCATWGYTASPTGKVTLMPRGFRQMPSDQFEEARAAWNTWRTTRPTATRPEEAPTLTSP